MTYYISAKRFYFDHKVKEGGYLAVTDGRFGKWTENVPEGAEVLDYSDYQIAPGLVDTHIPVSYTHLTLPTIYSV